MSPPDDIRGKTPFSETERIIKRDEALPHRSVGSESEGRGSREAADETLDETPATGQ